MSQTSPVSARDDLQAHYNDLLALQDQTDQVPLEKALDAVGLALSLLGHAQTPADIPFMAQEILDFLNSIEGAGYGGMASFEIVRGYAKSLADTSTDRPDTRPLRGGEK